MTRLNKILTFSAAFIVLVSHVFAVPEDRTKPITGKAEKTTIDANTNETVLTGKVVIRQGMLTIYADEVTIETDATTDKIEYILAIGNPVHFIDTPNIEKPQVEVEGRKIEFFALQNLIITLDDAKILNGGNEAYGKRIQYNTLTGFMTIEGECALNETSNCEQAEFLLQPGATE